MYQPVGPRMQVRTNGPLLHCTRSTAHRNGAERSAHSGHMYTHICTKPFCSLVTRGFLSPLQKCSHGAYTAVDVA